MQKIIEIKDFGSNIFGTKFFDGKKNLNLSFELCEGERLGIFAPTGSGKTTLLNEIAKKYCEKIKISYAFQDNRLLMNKTAEKNVAIVLQKKDSMRGMDFICDFDLFTQRKVLCRNLSGGECQRVNLARAFAFGGELFLLDEPFSSQDEVHKEMIFDLIKRDIIENKKTMVAVSHVFSDLQRICTRIINL